jgi:glycosyltransferase involved in cell wall biosynthesis
MRTPPLVSVVVPCYNAAAFVRDTLDSIQKQTYAPVEIVAINDGSTDNTLQILEAYASSDPRIRVVSQPNAGLPAARNSGIRQATGDLICFLDADDVFLPDKLARQVDYLMNNPAIDLVYSDYYIGDTDLSLIGLVAVRIPGGDLVDAYAAKNRFAPMVPLIRRSLIDRVGSFDESLRAAEDWDYWIRCAKAGRFGYLSGPVAIYRSHPSQMHNDGDRMFHGGRRVIDKHFRADGVRYRRALACFYWANAKCRITDSKVRAALYLLASEYHSRLAGGVSRD